MPVSESALARLREILRKPGAPIEQDRRIGNHFHKAKDLPQLRDESGTPLTRYAIEKAIGKRRENGASKLKRLTNRHYNILALHLAGKSLEDICSLLRVSYTTVSRVVNDPMAQSVLKRVYNHREEEIHALAGKAIAVTRAAMNDDAMGTRLKGVDRFLKIRETMLGKDDGRESAEDVVTRILENAKIMGNVNIQVNNGATSATSE